MILGKKINQYDKTLGRLSKRQREYMKIKSEMKVREKLLTLEKLKGL